MSYLNVKILNDLRKKWGKHNINPTGYSSRIELGLSEFDVLMGGGLPRGKIIEVYGNESVGKSTFCLEIAKRAQKSTFVTWLDYEWAWEDKYAQQIGVSLEEDKLLLVRPSTVEDGFELMKTMMLNSPGGLYVLDSLAACEPMDENGKEMSSNRIGLHASAVSNCLRRIMQYVGQSGAILLVINQVRVKITKGGPGGMTVGKTTTGGNALKFYAAMRWKLVRKKKLSKKLNGEDVPVWFVELAMVKTKVSKTEGETINLWVVPGFGVRVVKPRAQLNED